MTDNLQILIGDCQEMLKGIPDDSVQCAVTSPPYWRQRDYGHDGQIGLEKTPEEYIARLTDVFSEVRRILKPDGTCWVNIGDKWASGGNGGGGSFMDDRGEAWSHAKDAKGWRSPPPGYKDKDLVGLPFMLAFAMRAEGWFWRQCNIWAKPNCMPESVRDRTTASHEYVLHFSKSNDYFYDSDAARTPAAPSSETRLQQNVESQLGSDQANGGAKSNGTMKAVMRGRDKQCGHSRKHAGFNERWDESEKEGTAELSSANLRSVWWVSPAQTTDGHYAVMPDAIARLCILPSSRPGDVVLDPFGGAGTTGKVALELGRKAILIELNPEYGKLIERRTDVTPGLPLA